MQMRYRYRIEPTPAQQRMLARVFGCCRVVFNDALRVRDEAYRAGIKLSDTEIQRRVITQAKGTSERAWLCRGAQCGVGAVGQRLSAGVAQLLRLTTGKRKGRKVGRPRMKSRKDHRQSFRLTRNGFRVRPNGRLFVAKVGEVRVRWSRDCPREPSSVTIIRNRTGTTTPVSSSTSPRRRCRRWQREAGVDVGIARLATVATTDGARIDVANPKHLGRKLRKLRRLEREKSRRQQGSPTGTSPGAKWRSRTARWRGRGGTITTSRLWRWFARTK